MFQRVCVAALIVNFLCGVSFAQETQAEPSVEGQAGTILQKLGGNSLTVEDMAAIQEVRASVITGLAMYPDEVIDAILVIARNPRPLFEGLQPVDTEWNAAFDFLSSSTDVVPILRSHPRCLILLGLATRDGSEALYEAIDLCRAGQPLPPIRDPEEFSDSVLESYDDDYWGYDWDSYGYDDDDHHTHDIHVSGDGGGIMDGTVVIGDDGTIAGRTSGSRTIETEQGTASMDTSGQFHANLNAGTSAGHHETTITGPDGKEINARSDSSMQATGDGATRSANGTVEGPEGNHASWENSSTVERTGDGVSGSGTRTVTGQDGGTATIDHSTTIKLDDGDIIVDHDANITTEDGRTADIDKSGQKPFWESNQNPGAWAAAIHESSARQGTSSNSNTQATSAGQPRPRSSAERRQAANAKYSVRNMDPAAIESSMRNAQSNSRRELSRDEATLDRISRSHRANAGGAAAPSQGAGQAAPSRPAAGRGGRR